MTKRELLEGLELLGIDEEVEFNVYPSGNIFESYEVLSAIVSGNEIFVSIDGKKGL